MFGIDFIPIVHFLGYPGLFTVIFLESGVFFGFFLPGASLLFIAGMLSSLGFFNIWLLIIFVFVAAILGDTAGYVFGWYVGKAIYKRENSRFFRQEHVQLAHDFFEKYGKAAVLLARFVPIARTFVPILAGVGGMSYRVFLFYNVLGAIVWACGVTLLGFFVGEYLPNAEKYLTIFIGGIIALTSIPLIYAWWKQWNAGETEAPCGIIFDLDNTLSRATEPLSLETASGLSKLLSRLPVAVMSGASIERVRRDVVNALHADTNFRNLYLFPDTAASGYAFVDSAWKEVYKKTFAPGEKERIVKILEEGLRETGIVAGSPQHGDQILARDTQVTLAAIGIDAPRDMKAAWDPDRKRRAKLKSYLDPKLPQYDVRISSRTAIDITKKGVDKAGGVKWFAEKLGVSPHQLLFVGDDLGRGGNDEIVIPTGIQTEQTSGPEETVKIINRLLAITAAR